MLMLHNCNVILHRIRGGGTGGAGGAIAPPIFASLTLAPPIIAGSSKSWGCYSYPNFFDLPAGLRIDTVIQLI